MTINGKRDDFIREDFYGFEKISPIFFKKKIYQMIEEITEHVSTWRDLAAKHNVPPALTQLTDCHLRLKI